jgi:dTDP-4-dehydrorhamnose reductase
MNRRWLITGASGLLGPYLGDAIRANGTVITTAREAGDLRCDLTDRDAVQTMIDRAAPDVVIHAAAMTDVDRCEREVEAAYAANCNACAHLAQTLPLGAQLVVISTDQVYPDTPGPHREAETAPVNVYGKSKLAGETEALGRPGTLVLRTNFFGPSRHPGRQSLSDFVVTSLADQRQITLFSDVLFSPLHMTTLAALVVECAGRGLTGVLNAGCRAGDSKAAFALAVARRLGLQTETATIGSSSAMPGRAPRPRDLRMDVSCIEAALGRPMTTLEDEVAKL